MSVEAAQLLADGAVAGGLVVRAQLFAAGQEIIGPYSVLPAFSSSEWRMISGIWLRVKSSVSGMMPQTLNAHPGVGREASATQPR